MSNPLPKRILFAIDEFGPQAEGGANVVVQNLINELKDKTEIGVLATHRDGEKLIKRQKDGYTLYSIKVSYNPRFRAYKSLYNPTINTQLKTVLADFKPDVLHAHTIHMYLTYYLLLLAKKQRVRVVFTGHDVMPVFYGRLSQFYDSDDDGILDSLDCKAHFFKEAWKNKLHFNPLRNLIIKSILKRITVVTVSLALKDVYETNGIKVNHVIHNGVSLISKQQKKQENSNKLTMLMAGRIREDKGSYLALEVLKAIPEARLIVAGKEDSDMARFRRLAKEAGIDSKIDITGQVFNNEMAKLYQSADVVLVLSKCFDSYPTVVVEAIANKTPVIASCFGGAKEVVGQVVNPFDIKQVISALKNISYGEVKTNISIDQTIAAYQNVYSANR